MNWTWPGIVVAACIVLMAFWGFHRGFIKQAVSTLLLFLSIVIVWVINPYVNQFLRDHTPIHKAVSETVYKTVDDMLPTESSGSMTLDQAIEQMPLPDLIKDILKENNNSASYAKLGIDKAAVGVKEAFEQYLGRSLAEIVTNVISFLASFLLAMILIRILAFALNLFAKLPVLHGANKIAGAALGIIEAVVFVWILMMILTLLANTSVGRTVMEYIYKDTFLDFLYDHNVFVKFFANIFYI